MFKRILKILLLVIVVATNTINIHAEGLSLSVSTSEPKCGEPMTFTLNASGGSGTYKYMLSTVCDDENVYVIDPTRSSYVESNEFTFTFYASGTYSLYFYVLDTGDGYDYKRETITVSINDTNYPSVNEVVESAVNECLNAGQTSDFDKALWLHDWLLNRCKYDNSYLYCGPEGVLCRGIGTCESYHRAYAKLLTKAGIEATDIRDTGDNHVWTAAKLDGKWYHIDPTWDDSYNNMSSYESHLYFGLTDEIIQMVHKHHSPKDGYNCNDLDDNYFIKTGEISTWSDELEDSIKNNIKENKTSFDIEIKNQLPESYNNVIYNLVAYKFNRDGIDIDGAHYNLTTSYKYDRWDKSIFYSFGNLTITNVEKQDIVVNVKDLSLQEGSIVYVDGQSVTVDKDNNVVIDEDSKVLITYQTKNSDSSDKHNQYPTGMSVYFIKHNSLGYYLTHNSNFDNILNYAGASIRVSGKKGIRIITSIATDKRDKLINNNIDGYKVMEYGTLMCWASKLAPNKEPTLGMQNVQKGRAYSRDGNLNAVYKQENGLTKYTNTLVGNYSDEQCASDFAMRSYMIIRPTDASDDSRDIVLYGGTLYRSISYVALQNKNIFKPGTDGYEYIWSLIKAAYPDTYNAEYKG